MKKEDLIKLKENLSSLNKEELRKRDLAYLRKLNTGEIYGPKLGYASIDKPWLGYYPEEIFYERKKYNKIFDYIKDIWAGQENDIMIHYYGSDITALEFYKKVEETARSLKTYGLEKGDTIITNLESVPEFMYLFFASELIGVNVKNKIGAGSEEIAEVINESNAKCFFAHDYISVQDSNIIYDNTGLDNIIVISPLEHTNVDTSNLRVHIRDYIDSKYGANMSYDNRNVSWKEFISEGYNYQGEIYVESDENTKLFSAYTSGTTGQRKEVIHSSETIMGMLDQMAFQSPNSNKEERETWFWPIYPPSLVAAIVAYLCLPLVQGKKIILDPYFDYKDIDLEIMHYKPNSTGLVPVFIEALIESERIPEDYDLSHLKVLGFGGEALTRKLISRVEEFLEKHNCRAQLNGGIGNSEGGSQMTIAFTNDILKKGSTGIPLINTIIGIFEPGTENELGYGIVGEICKAGPGIMMGYSSKEETDKVLKPHSDGMSWLHTGDYGFITDNGFVFVLGREGIKVYSGNTVFPLVLENKISDIEGVKTAIIVSGESKNHPGYEAPYLFVVPMPGYDNLNLSNELSKVLEAYEIPEQVLVSDYIPTTYYKADRKKLKKVVEKRN